MLNCEIFYPRTTADELAGSAELHWSQNRAVNHALCIDVIPARRRTAPTARGIRFRELSEPEARWRAKSCNSLTCLLDCFLPARQHIRRACFFVAFPFGVFFA